MRKTAASDIVAQIQSCANPASTGGGGGEASEEWWLR